MNIFARAFVAANRVFGAFTAAAGALLLAMTLVSFVRGSLNVTSFALWATFAVVLILVGVLYLRAPLSRAQKTRPVRDETQKPRQ